MKQRRLSDEEKIELVKLFKKGKKSKELSEYFGITDVAIRVLLKNRGYKYNCINNNKKYEINENFFDVIDNQDKAYFLGFLYADGCNKTNRNVVTLSLKEDDKEILEKLNNLIFKEKKLSYEIVKKNNTSNRFNLVIHNKHMSNKLIELGVDRRKTFKIVYPTWLDKQFYSHFIRGYMDGDGYIGIIKSKLGYLKHKVTFVGTESFCNSLMNIFKENLNIHCSIETRHPERNNNIRTISISGRLQVTKLLNYIYEDSNLKMERKYLKYIEILNTKKK